MDDYPIRDVSAWTQRDFEQMGTKPKYWLDSDAGEVWLYKSLRVDAVGQRYGDDWAEVIATGVAGLLGIPTAHVEFAKRGSDVGTISLLMHDPETEELVHGNEMLAAIAANYDKTRKRNNPAYTVGNVHTCLDGAGPPATWTGPKDADAFDVWAGYLLLDAWIANQDRHHENWGTLVNRTTGSRVLAPSFDHGSALGFNVFPHEAQAMILQHDAVRRWAERARSNQFADKPRLVDVAWRALSKTRPGMRRYWLERLEGLDEASWRSVITRVPSPRMSEVSRTFVSDLLAVNRGRLLDGAS